MISNSHPLANCHSRGHSCSSEQKEPLRLQLWPQRLLLNIMDGGKDIIIDVSDEDDETSEEDVLLHDADSSPRPKHAANVPAWLWPGGRTKCRAAVYGLSKTSFLILCHLRSPPFLFNMLYYLNRFPDFQGDNFLLFIDVMCGIGMIFKVCSEAGIPGAKYDWNHDNVLQNILTPEGLLTLLQWSRLLVPGEGATHWGTLCSTWVFMSRSTTWRHANNILGVKSDGSQTIKVQEGNVMVSRMALVWHFLICRAILNLLEQPITSLMPSHPRLLQLIALLKALAKHINFINTWMSAFGSASPKGTQLIGNSDDIWMFHRQMKRANMHSPEGITFKDERGKVHGGRKVGEGGDE